MNSVLSERTAPAGVSTILAPFRSDLGASAELGRAAIFVRAGPGDEANRWVERFVASLRTGGPPGRLVVVDGAPAGVVVWEEPCSLGATVELIHLAPNAVSRERYHRLLLSVEQVVGPIAFVGGPLGGLEHGDESELMAGLGYVPFGRSEMRLGSGVALPEPRLDPPTILRHVEPTDEPALARLHARAYHGTLDRYLFWADADEEVDARDHFSDVFRGRWGALVASGSWVAEESGRPVGAVLSVRTDVGILIVDVMVDPERRGAGIGRACLLASVRSVRSAGEEPIYLNVTEGNESALRLYDRTGFVRSLGPTRDWYNSARIPVPPPGVVRSVPAGRLGLARFVREPSQGGERR